MPNVMKNSSTNLARIGLLLLVTACTSPSASHVADAGSTTAAPAPSPLNMTIRLAPLQNKNDTFVFYVNPPAGQAHLFYCQTPTVSACVPGQTGAAQLQSFTSQDNAKLYMSLPFTMTADSDFVFVAVDSAGKTVLTRSIHLAKINSAVALDSPKDLQVWQRSDAVRGKVTVSFHIVSTLGAQFGRARVAGLSGTNSIIAPRAWQEFTLTPAGDGTVTQAIDAPAGGWFSLELQLLDATKQHLLAVGHVNRVGVGEVFVVAGQSNSTNCGWSPQKVDNDYVVSTDGSQWQRGDDPQLGVHDDAVCGVFNGRGGSTWPAAGNAIVKGIGVPVAFASTGFSGTEVSQWLPNATTPPDGDSHAATLFTFTLNREKQLAASGYRAVLWHQGENDAAAGTTHDDYVADLTAVITGLRQGQTTPTPWLIAVASYCAVNAYPATAGVTWNGPSAAITSAQQDMVAKTVLSELYAGPSTDDMNQTYRGSPTAASDCHFNDAGSKEAGNRWADKVLAFLKQKVQ